MKYRVIMLSLVAALSMLLISVNVYAEHPCDDPPGDPGPEDSKPVRASRDPNALTGPGGYGDQNYIQFGSVLPYMIEFENDAIATAPAQQVDITNNLDSNLDWSTFELTEIKFGDIFIAVPPGSKTFETKVSMTYQDVTFNVEINAGIDETSGQVYAHFYSIDPATGIPPAVDIGFLPPEDGTGRGMGHVSYVINHKDTLDENTEIRNIALIVFDLGEQIYTNQVDPHDPSQGTDPAKEALVSLDKNRPSSSVISLPEEATSTVFTVAWAGSDSASGIASYNIYVRDGQEITWYLWKERTTATSAEFAGTYGHIYEFFSVATDNVGFIEDKFPVPDTLTYVHPAVVIDSDGDGVSDTEDNCPFAANADQSDQDGDGIGDVCDPCPLEIENDTDGDGVCGNIDNCPVIANPGQSDVDNDGLGDVCDFDDDNDDVDDINDNCPVNSNTDQADLDGDGIGDVCDEDDDNDGVPDTEDNCPVISNIDQADLDGDGLGDVCDEDDDNDGVADSEDNCPLTANDDQADLDGDGKGDVCDEDDDNDGVVDLEDNCPFDANDDQADFDADGLGDVCDEDDDNDGVVDLEDNCPLTANEDQADNDADGQGDICDEDDDNDGVVDLEDNCPFDANDDQADFDADGLGDVCDEDDDNDGVVDLEDNCPLTANEDQADNDADGQGDICDEDDDNDGVVDLEDNCPFTFSEDQSDSDGDGLGDICDTCPLDADNDIDADGICGDVDNCPAVSNIGQDDLDQDGLGDLCDPQTCGNGILETIETCDDGNVIDGDNCSAQCIKEITISVSKAEVEWNKSLVKYTGSIELPLGLYPVNITPQSDVSIEVGNLAPVIVEDAPFTVKAVDDKKWEFKDVGGVSKFNIDWKGATFDYKGIVHVKANHIGRETTNIEIERDGFSGEFTLQFGNISIHFGAENSVVTVPETLKVDADDTDGEIEVELPFTLTPDMVMIISRSEHPDTEITVGDFFTNSTGKFALQANFDSQGLTGLDLPATLQLRIALGQIKYPGMVLINSGWKSIKAKEWKHE
ncbi:MAG: thrombospondin type 3 repeat-containing protein [Desulfobulbaceae bacterium]|nr:thrombospondin type 3 repeat-containing protein [Desulfobulbaceae bacterium]